MRALKCLRNIEIIRKKHEMAVAKQQSEAWRKALDGVPDSLRMLLEINNTENVTAMGKTKILLGFNIFFFLTD